MKVVAFDVDLDFVLGGVAVFDIVFAFVVVLFLSLSSFLSNVLVILFLSLPTSSSVIFILPRSVRILRNSPNRRVGVSFLINRSYIRSITWSVIIFMILLGSLLLSICMDQLNCFILLISMVWCHLMRWSSLGHVELLNLPWFIPALVTLSMQIVYLMIPLQWLHQKTYTMWNVKGWHVFLHKKITFKCIFYST